VAYREILDGVPRDRVRGTNWYDRNPETTMAEYSDTAAPHAETERLSVTCPADRKFLVELLYAEVTRLTAGVAAGFCASRFKLTPKGETEKELLTVQFLDNNVGYTKNFGIGQSITMFQGDVLKGYTLDLSTGGTVNYQLSVKLTEFDV